MAGLQFPFEELIREAMALEGIAKELLDSSKLWSLRQFTSNLESMKSGPAERSRRVELPPLSTEASDSYDGSARPGIRMCVTGVWDLCALGEKGAGRKVEFSGIASTKVTLHYEDDPDTTVAEWKIELGDSESPGCYFHIHVPRGGGGPSSRASLPVPRLPSLFVTPMAALEYALGEVFQKEWERVSSRRNPHADWWRSTQKKRLCCLLEWQLHCLLKSQHQGRREAMGSSPWMTLKAARPDAKEFLDDKT